MQIQRGLQRDSSLAKFVLGAHPIIEHFIEMLRIRETISSYVPSDKRMKLDDDKILPLLIHNILTTPNPLYEMEDWLRPLDAEKVGLRPEEIKYIQDDRIGRGLARFYRSRHAQNLEGRRAISQKSQARGDSVEAHLVAEEQSQTRFKTRPLLCGAG